jgi:hypothetical protein
MQGMLKNKRVNLSYILVTINQETVNCPIYTHLDFSTCYILTDFLSRSEFLMYTIQTKKLTRTLKLGFCICEIITDLLIGKRFFTYTPKNTLP